jgi:hypothetical protein
MSCLLGKVQVHKVGLKVNGTFQLLVYGDEVCLLGDNIETIKKNTGILKDASNKQILKGSDDGVSQRKLSLCCCFFTRI